MKPTDYTPQAGCHNCNNCFRKGEYDDGCQYFCTVDAPERPLCGSVAMDESYLHFETDKEWNEADDAWTEWSKGRKVEAWGLCSKFDLTTLNGGAGK